MSGYHPPNRAAVAKSMWFTWIQPSLAIRARKTGSSLRQAEEEASQISFTATGAQRDSGTHESVVNKTGSSPR